MPGRKRTLVEMNSELNKRVRAAPSISTTISNLRPDIFVELKHDDDAFKQAIFASQQDILGDQHNHNNSHNHNHNHNNNHSHNNADIDANNIGNTTTEFDEELEDQLALNPRVDLFEMKCDDLLNSHGKTWSDHEIDRLHSALNQAVYKENLKPSGKMFWVKIRAKMNTSRTASAVRTKFNLITAAEGKEQYKHSELCSIQQDIIKMRVQSSVSNSTSALLKVTKRMKLAQDKAKKEKEKQKQAKKDREAKMDRLLDHLLKENSKSNKDEFLAQSLMSLQDPTILLNLAMRNNPNLLHNYSSVYPQNMAQSIPARYQQNMHVRHPQNVSNPALIHNNNRLGQLGSFGQLDVNLPPAIQSVSPVITPQYINRIQPRNHIYHTQNNIRLPSVPSVVIPRLNNTNDDNNNNASILHLPPL